MTAQKRASSNKKNQSNKQQQQQQPQQRHVQQAPKNEVQQNTRTPVSLTQNKHDSSDSKVYPYNKYHTNTPSSSRLPNTTVCLPIVYGSIAFFLGKKADEFHTHKWTLYVRGPNNEDLSAGISKVIFHLHPSFPQPVRELTTPPFEVTEKGWGEFEATIKIVWRDSCERATTLTHGIKLYPQSLHSLAPNSSSSSSTKEPVVSEFYDEVVFTEPTEDFFHELQRWKVLSKVNSNEEPVQDNFKSFSDEDDFNALLNAQKFLQNELEDMKERIMTLDRERMEVDKALKVCSNSTSATAVSASVNSVSSPKASSKASSGNSGKKKLASNDSQNEPTTKKAKANN